MMKNTLLAIIIILFCGQVQAQDIIIPEQNKTVVMKFTADWCGPCGGWGWNWFDSFVHEYHNNDLKAIPVAVHTTSSHNPDLNFKNRYYFISNFDQTMSGIPSFSVGHKLNFGQVPAMRDRIESDTKGQTIVNAGFITKIVDDTMTIKTKTKFFARGAGDYFVATYIYESNIISYQYARSDTAEHNQILRDIPGAKTMGTPIPGRIFAAGDIFEDSISFTIPKTWNRENLHIFTVVWKNEIDTYKVANANDIATYPLNIDNIRKNTFGIHISPNPATDNLSIHVNSTWDTDMQINITDIMGRTIFINKATTNSSETKINTSSYPNGLYSVTITTDDNQKTERFVISR